MATRDEPPPEQYPADAIPYSLRLLAILTEVFLARTAVHRGTWRGNGQKDCKRRTLKRPYTFYTLRPDWWGLEPPEKRVLPRFRANKTTHRSVNAMGTRNCTLAAMKVARSPLQNRVEIECVRVLGGGCFRLRAAPAGPMFNGRLPCLLPCPPSLLDKGFRPNGGELHRCCGRERLGLSLSSRHHYRSSTSGPNALSLPDRIEPPAAGSTPMRD